MEFGVYDEKCIRGVLRVADRRLPDGTYVCTEDSTAGNDRHLGQRTDALDTDINAVLAMAAADNTTVECPSLHLLKGFDSMGSLFQEFAEFHLACLAPENQHGGLRDGSRPTAHTRHTLDVDQGERMMRQQGYTFGETAVWVRADAHGTEVPLQQLYMPINKPNCHWAAAELDITARKISVMDSFHGLINWDSVCDSALIPWLGAMEMKRADAHPSALTSSGDGAVESKTGDNCNPASGSQTADAQWTWEVLHVPRQGPGTMCGACTVHNIYHRMRSRLRELDGEDATATFLDVDSLTHRRLLLSSLRTGRVSTDGT